MRPDERSSQDRIKRDEDLERNIKRTALTGASLGAGSAALGLGSKIAPFLSEYIPVDLAVKGISKISPKMGSFLKKGMSQGLNIKDGINFLKDKFSQTEQESQSQNAPDNRNIIQQYSDELHSFLDSEIKKGRDPIEAGALAQLNNKFKKPITALEKDHKTNFSSILQSVYGGGQQAINQPQQSSQQPQQNGNTDQALMAALEKILSM